MVLPKEVKSSLMNLCCLYLLRNSPCVCFNLSRLHAIYLLTSFVGCQDENFPTLPGLIVQNTSVYHIDGAQRTGLTLLTESMTS